MRRCAIRRGARFAALDPIAHRARTALWLAGRRRRPRRWRFGWITCVVSTLEVQAPLRINDRSVWIGGRSTASGSAVSRNLPKQTGWRSGHRIVRSRSKPILYLAESFRTGEAVRAAVAGVRWSGTTQTWRLEKLGYQHRAPRRRARSMSYARRHSTNVCPGNRVRYMSC